MTCHSGGTLEIYVEPFRPAPRLLITGDSPIAEALAELAALDDFRVSREVPTDATASDTAERYVVLAGMSGEDQIDLERALALDPSYLAFVGSRKRLAEITSRLQERGVSAEQLARVKGPAGLDIGAQTAFEIAISIMAEIVQHRRRPSPPNPLSRSAGEGGRGRGLESAPDAPRVDIAVDPVCGMEVAVAGARHVLEHAGQQFYFCCPACRRLFAADPEQFLTRPATHDQDRSINAFSG